MKKLNTTAVKWLKITHLVFVVLMLGGIITSATLRLSLKLTDFEQVYMGYKMLQNVSDYVVRYGAQGLLLTGILYSVWTNWGFFRYSWVTVKWAIFLLQTVFGIVFIDRWMVDNLKLLEAEKSMALSNPVFLHQHAAMQIGAWAQVAVTACLIGVSVLKPWKKKNQG
jgi:hypothetical protein